MMVKLGGSWEGGHRTHDCLERLAHEQGYRVDGICEVLGVGERYAREVFLRDVGIPPKRWLGNLRMEVARKLLAEGADLARIHLQLGFSHPNSFRRAYRAVFGSDPGGFSSQEGQAEG
jgi:AraC-like DNA-binding protein